MVSSRDAKEIQPKNLREGKYPPGGARAGHASLMRPNRPPLRLGPNAAAAIIAAKVTRGHCTSLGYRARHPDSDSYT